MRFLKLLFTWWHSATLGTLLFTWSRGRLVGRDEQGNRYYEEKKLRKGAPRKRRWVIYNGPVEASRVPAEWHAWLHYIVDEPPASAHYVERPWMKPHRSNLTGTQGAYRPEGSLHRSGQRPKGTGDYEPWSPDAGENGDGKNNAGGKSAA
jgi:NADH:ubiquinone oxidoreductase subunit